MDRIHLMELVRSRQTGLMSRREFLKRATIVLGSSVAATTLLAACTPAADETVPPVIAATQPPSQPSAEAVSELTAGMVTYPGTAETELMGYIAYETNAPARPAVVVLQEWWGLNDHIKDVAERFARAGFVALAPDLYHGVVTTEPDEARKQAMELGMRDAVAEIEQAIAYLKEQPFVTDKVGIVGFCMGGGLVLQTAVNSMALSAGVVFYGSPLAPDVAKNMQSPIQTFIGTADNIPVSGVEAMHAAFDEIGLENAYQVYDGVQHAFFNDTRSSYDPGASADAWDRTLAWFRGHLNA